MFARKLSRKGILISVVLMVVTVFLVNQIDLAMEVVAQLGVEFAYAFRVVNELIASGEYPDNYFFNLGMLAVFTLAGAGISISSVWSRHKIKGTARKIG